ncbi:MAG: porin [Sphingobacteriaceae bacterium]
MKQIISIVIIMLAFQLTVKAQSNNAPSDYNPHDLKITGYFQFQYQKAAEKGAAAFAGGDFAKEVDDRFMVRRGRFKFDRVDEFTNIVFQLDATQDGVSLRDGFIQLKDPKWHIFTLTAGQFTKPFGYILSYSSANREFPERPRMHQSLFPGERDLGAMLNIKFPKFPFIDYEIGFFNGSGMNAKDYDSKKDLSSALHFNFKELKKEWNLGFGLSYYNGFVRQGTSTTYRDGIINGQPGFIAETAPYILGAYASRRYYGFNLQTDFKWALGKTHIKTEFISGQQPGQASSASITAAQASKSLGAQPATDIYNRNFKGYFIWLSQEIPHTELQWIASYDRYDPNSYVSGKQVGLADTNTSSGDISFNTFGTGLVYYLSKQVKFVVYYDHPVNESTSLTGYTQDLKDDVFTIRAQYRF